MKRKIIYAFSLITFLSIGGVSLVSCDPEINEVKETKYKVNFTNTNDYEITGINTEGYLENEIVNFEINVLNENLMINEVKTDDSILNSETNKYSFTMPNKDITIAVSLKNKSIFDLASPGSNKNYPDKLEDFTPTEFKEDTFKEASKEALGAGVNHIVYTFNLNNDHEVHANIIEVDLTKARLTTNYATNGIATPYSQLLDYEAKTNKKVMAITNGDFFATGVGISVNAYALNNKIIKAGHNDNGIYDYKDPQSDIPASNPMLIGISGETALISSIIDTDSKEECIKSQLSYSIVYEDNGEVKTLDHVLNTGNNLSSNNDYLLITSNMSIDLGGEQYLYKIKYSDTQNVITEGYIEEIINYGIDLSYQVNDTNEYFYLLSNKELSFKVNDRIGYTLNSDDGTFKFYKDIIGGRQSLVENGEIAETVYEENTNGAQTSNIPRTAVGVKDEHTVLLCSIESLRYGSKSTSDSDPYGVDLPELAEFMRYIGCYDAMNFDGGGSTQLITKNNNGEGEAKVKVRSSDYGTYELNDSRRVYNTVIISTK